MEQVGRVILATARDAMMARGKGALGEKSVLDMLDAISHAIAGLDDPALVRNAAREAVTRTLDQFRNRPYQLGRARAYGDGSIGIDDARMLALARILEGL